MENNYWYIGQKVSDQRFGDGIVVDINYIGSYPIKVEFSGYSQTYTLDGKFNNENTFSILSQNLHVPLEYKPIHKLFNKGEVVWYSPSGGLWYLGIYDSLEERLHKVNLVYLDEKSADFEYFTDEEIKKFIELKV